MQIDQIFKWKLRKSKKTFVRMEKFFITMTELKSMIGNINVYYVVKRKKKPEKIIAQANTKDDKH